MNLHQPFKRSVIQVVVSAFVLMPQFHHPALAQPDLCFARVRTTVTTTVWQEIRTYFATLLTSPNQRNKAQLIRLRASIVRLESEKQRLLDVVLAHTLDRTTGVVAARDLSITEIPNILQHIRSVIDELNSMAEDANLFAAEPAFRKLILTLDAKREVTLCSISRAAAAGFVDKDSLKRLAGELKLELDAIGAAEDALATYIRKLP